MDQATGIDPLWIISGMAIAIVGLAAFVRWLVMKVIYVVNTSTAAVVAAKGSMDKLTKAVDHLTAAVDKEHQPIHKPRHR